MCLLVGACSKASTPSAELSADPTAPESLASDDETAKPPAAEGEWKRAADLLTTASTRAEGERELRRLVDDAIQPTGAIGAAAMLEALIASPELDQSAALRVDLAEMLGAFGDRRGTPALIHALRQSIDRQPVAVHRAAAEAIGKLRDPAGINALVTVLFRVPDVPTTTNIGEKAKAALAAIGEPAVAAVVDALRGQNEELNRLGVDNGVPKESIVLSMVGLLAGLGRATAVDALLQTLPPKCAATDNDTNGLGSPATLRAAVADALGYIADDRAVAPLCACALTSEDPGDMFPIAEALGRIGGVAAVNCLAKTITGAEYSRDNVPRDFALQLRWEAARFGVHAATPDTVATIEAAIVKASKNKQVRKEMKQWAAGIDAIHECNDDTDCWKSKLADPKAAWIVREKAALELARRKHGDPAIALAIAFASSVGNPDARVTMAWLAASMLSNGDIRCPECVDALRAQLDRDAGKLDRRYQLSVLIARYTIAKLSEAASDGSAG